MTTGSWYFPTALSSPTIAPLVAKRQWSGKDGKYEVADGIVQLKWNNYSTQRERAVFGHKGMGDFNVSYAVYGNSCDRLWSSTVRYTRCFAGHFTHVGCPKWTSNDQLILLNKLGSLVKGSEFDLVVAAGEAKATVNTVVGAASSLLGSYRALRKGDFKGALRHLGVPDDSRARRALRGRDVAGRWLELQYGWKPLLADARAAADAYAAIVANNLPRRKLYHVSRTLNGAYVTNQTLANVYAIYRTQRKRTLYYEAIETTVDPFLRLGITGAVDPLRVAWELTPFSFVVDWFLPIGAYFEALSYIPKLQGRFMYSDRAKGTTSSGFKATKAPSALPFCKVAGYPYAITALGGEFERYVYPPKSSPSVPLPSFNSLTAIKSGSRVQNAIALLYQAFAPEVRVTKRSTPGGVLYSFPSGRNLVMR